MSNLVKAIVSKTYLINQKQKQKQLKHINYYKGKIDGVWGNDSKQATKDFQREYDLIADGVFGAATEEKNILVWKDIQRKLENKNCPCGTIDGVVGNKTINAIKKFQKANGLVADGIIGNETMTKLNETSIYMNDADWKKSKYFKKSEFKCNCNGKYCDGYGDGVSKQLVTDMNNIRSYFKKPITITSGVRCQKYNDSLKGSSKTSKHIEGKACDFWFSGMNKQEVINYCKTLSSYGYSYTNEDNMKNAVHYNTNE